MFFWRAGRTRSSALFYQTRPHRYRHRHLEDAPPRAGRSPARPPRDSRRGRWRGCSARGDEWGSGRRNRPAARARPLCSGCPTPAASPIHSDWSRRCPGGCAPDCWTGRRAMPDPSRPTLDSRRPMCSAGGGFRCRCRCRRPGSCRPRPCRRRRCRRRPAHPRTDSPSRWN